MLPSWRNLKSPYVRSLNTEDDHEGPSFECCADVAGFAAARRATRRRGHANIFEFDDRQRPAAGFSAEPAAGSRFDLRNSLWCHSAGTPAFPFALWLCSERKT